MTFLQSISSVFRNYANPKGHATRSEFWWWQLFVFVLFAIASIIDEVLGFENAIFSSVLSWGLLCPNICVAIRRCHDSNHTAWWIICPIANIVIMLLPSVGGELQDEPSKKGCLATFLSLVGILVVSVTVICIIDKQQSRPVTVPIEETEISRTEQLRELSGMKFLKEVEFVKATRYSDGYTDVEFRWLKPLTSVDVRKIIKYAKSSIYPSLWEFPQCADSEEVVVQKIYSKDKDLHYYITYYVNSLTLRYGAPYIPREVEQILEGITIPSYTLVWYIYYDSFTDDSMNAILQLHTPYVELQKELEKYGYVIEENNSEKIILAAHEYSADGYLQVRTSVEINKKHNVVTLYWDTY